ncbi:uncharacterized protein LOC135378161 [Ornithodoros turicata]|uniref:uncharacterized protein LOC135378161 n=1 Tax=Ornithodoros turicata TaxID=34597 RepID=UPI003139D8B1
MVLPNYVLVLFCFLLQGYGDALKVKSAQRTKCQRYSALRKFSSCGAAVSLAVREKALLEKPNHNATCQKAKEFDKCFQESLQSTRCQRSSEFSFHLQHVSKLVSEMYKESCSLAGESSTMLSDMSTVCDIRVAVVRFLECASSFYSTEPHSNAAPTQSTTLAVHFGVMFDAPMSSGKHTTFECRRNHKFKNCIENIHLYSECGIGTEVHSHLKYLASVIHRRFVGKCSIEALHGTPETTEVECELLPFLRKFLRCGVDRYENAGEVIEQDLCGKVAAYKDCVISAETTAHCRMKNLSLSYHMEYLYKLMTATNRTCKPSKQIETSTYRQACKRTTLFNSFFSCGTEVQSRLEGLKKGDKERCRISENFEKCFMSAREQSGCLLSDDSTSIMSSLLETWKKERDKECAQFNPPVAETKGCLQGPAVKRVFQCGLTFQTAVREVKYTPLDMSPGICRHLDDLNTCIADVKNGTGCALSEFHAHVAPLLQPFTIDYTQRCEKIRTSSNQSAPLVVPRGSPGCKRLSAVKKIFHCGLSFSKILEEMQLVHQKVDVLCPLLKKYEMCVPDSAAEVGCKDDPVMKAHVKAFTKILRGQYYDSCIQNRKSGSSKINLRRQRGGLRSRTRDILGSANVLKQEMKNMRQVLSNISRDPQAQHVEDYYGSDYEDYIEEDDKVPDSLDIKPAYDYAEKETTKRTQTETTSSTTPAPESKKPKSNNRPEIDVRKMQRFWADLQDAGKIRAQRDSSVESSLSNLPAKMSVADFSKPGAYFVNELTSGNGDNVYVPRLPQVNGARSVFQKEPNGAGIFQKVPVLKRLSNTARQGEGEYDDYSLDSPSRRMSKDEELEMYEDTRGMAETLRKEKAMGYGRYISRSGSPGHLRSLRRIDRSAIRRYPGEEDNIYLPERRFHARDHHKESDVRDRPTHLNRSGRLYDEYGTPGSGGYPLRGSDESPVLRRNFRRIGRMGLDPMDTRRLSVHQGINAIPHRGRARAFRNPDYEFLGDYEKGDYETRDREKANIEGGQNEGSQFPEDDGPVLPNDALENDNRMTATGPRKYISRRHGASSVLGPVRDLEPPSSVVNVGRDEEAHYLKDRPDGVPNERYARNMIDHGHAVPYSRKGSKAIIKPGPPLRLPPLHRSNDYDDRGDVGDYSDVLMKVDTEHRQTAIDNEEPIPQFAVKHIDSKERVPTKNNPSYYVAGGDYANRKTIRRIPALRNFEDSRYKRMPTILRPGGVRTYQGGEPYIQQRNQSRSHAPVRPVIDKGLFSNSPNGQGDSEDDDINDGDDDTRTYHSVGISNRIDRESSRADYPDVRNTRGREAQEKFYNPAQKRSLDIKKKRREPQQPYMRHIDDASGVLIEKKDENSGIDIAHAQSHPAHARLTPYEIERKRKNKLLKDDLDETLSKHKEESLNREDAFLFQDEKIGQESDEHLVGDVDAKVFDENRDYSELDAKLAEDSGYKGSWESRGVDEDMLQKHVNENTKKKDGLVEELAKKSSWYTDPIWNDKNDLFGMERLLSDQKGPAPAANETEEDDKNQCQQQYLERRSENCLRIFDDDFKAVGSNATLRDAKKGAFTPALVESVCSHAREFAQCIDLFAQKFRCAESQEIIRNLTEAHLRKVGVVFCAGCGPRPLQLSLLMFFLLHILYSY